MHATILAAELQRSRSRVVAARDDERRRLRRDLHDGLGPALTGVGFKADAARNYVRTQPGEAIELLSQLRAETAAALEDVRRLVYDLRPPVLDDVGLLEALRRLAERSRRGADGLPLSITLELPDSLPPLPTGVETATYRIVAEALTNVIRHSDASWAHVRMSVDSELHLSIANDQSVPGPPWTAGVGLSSMRERAAELGGVLSAGPEDQGAAVKVTVPLDPAGKP
jgi:signal transduction histidine kinase